MIPPVDPAKHAILRCFAAVAKELAAIYVNKGAAGPDWGDNGQFSAGPEPTDRRTKS
jgi:hypothetical protein